MAQDEELVTAVRALHEAFAKLRHLGGVTTDAVLHGPSATTYMFPEVQKELRQMERVARQHAEERAAILDALPAHLAILNETGTIVSVNAAWRRFACAQNYPDATAALGLNYLEVCRATTGEDTQIAHAVAQGLEEVLAGKSDSVNLQYPCRTPEALFWFNVMIAPMRGGARVGAVVMHVDITEKHAADAREDELRGRIERLMDQAGIGILVHRENVPVYANPALVGMLGLVRPEEILGLADVRRLFDELPGSRILSADDDATASATLRASGTIGAVRPDGTPVTFETRVFPITWGEDAAICAMFTEITEKLRIEDQLRAAQKLEAIGQLTGGIAHDFNNLLTVILGSGDLLVEALQHQPQLLRLAEQTVSMAERGADLTKNLLAFGRRQPLNPQRTDVNGRLSKLEDMLRRTLGASIEIALTLSPSLWPAMVDPGEFDSAILNLSINSRDAMPAGGHLRIATDNMVLSAQSPETALPPGGYVVVTVSDNGTGMTEDTLDHIYEPFFTTKDVGKGSGLGLSMVYGFLKQTGGQILISSELYAGTTVRLYLPRCSDEQTVPDVRVKEERVLPGRETILVVEDDDAVSQQLTMQLVQLGYTVLVASEGEPALAILRERSDIDLLLSDIVLPGGMNGGQIAEAARQIRPGLKVLFTSGYAENAVFIQGHLDPEVSLLSKPYRNSELAARIRKVLNL